MERYSVTILFNGRTSGGRRSWTGIIETSDVHEAISEAIAKVVREPKNGGSIYVAGVVAIEIPE